MALEIAVGLRNELKSAHKTRFAWRSLRVCARASGALRRLSHSSSSDVDDVVALGRIFEDMSSIEHAGVHHASARTISFLSHGAHVLLFCISLLICHRAFSFFPSLPLIYVFFISLTHSFAFSLAFA